MPPPTIVPTLSDEEMLEMGTTGRLQSISLRLPCACNLRCEYCYNVDADGNWPAPGKGECLTYDEVQNVLDQAFEAGAKYV